MTAEVDLVAYLTSKGIKTHRATGSEVVMQCFFGCTGSAARGKGKLYANTESWLYQCKVCNVSGNRLTLLQHFGDEDEIKHVGAADPMLRRRILSEAAELAHEMLLVNDAKLQYLLDRGIAPELIVSHKLGYVPQNTGLSDMLPVREELKGYQALIGAGLVTISGREFFNGSLVIPYHSHGSIVTLRAKHPDGKYQTVAEDDARLFNGDSLFGADDVLVVEGEFDTLAILSAIAQGPERTFAGLAVVGLPGAFSWPDALVERLSTARRVFLGFDPDDTGRKAAAKLAAEVGARARIVTLPNEGQDWTDWLKAGHTWRDVRDLLIEADLAGKQMFSAVDLATKWTKRQSEAPGLKLGWPSMDAILRPGLKPGQLLIPLATTGCIQGDADMVVNRGGKSFHITLRDLVHMLNGGGRGRGGAKKWDLSIPTRVQREVDGEVRLGVIKNAWFSGVKTTYAVTTETGRTIRATDEHPFLTERGWLRLDELQVGDLVHVRGERQKNRRTKINYAQRTGLLHHPYAGRKDKARDRGRYPLHRLVAEAALNGLDIDTFIRMTRDGVVSPLRFLDPNEWAVHHIDHDPTNNDPSNLKVLTHSEHAALHAAEGTTRNVQLPIAHERVVSVEPYGEEETYDIEVEDDPHNFIANGFVVHNTGKTVFLSNIAHNLRHKRVLNVSLEMTGAEVWEHMRRIHHFWNPKADMDKVFDDYARLRVTERNRIGAGDLGELIAEYREDVGYQPDVVIVDYLQYYARGFRGGSMYDRVGDAVMELKAVAKEEQVGMIVPSQVNRGAERGKPLSLNDARDAGTIEETADFVISLFRPDQVKVGEGEGELPPQTGAFTAAFLKSRHGGVGRQVNLRLSNLSLAITDVVFDQPNTMRVEQENAAYRRGMHYDDYRAQIDQEAGTLL